MNTDEQLSGPVSCFTRSGIKRIGRRKAQVLHALLQAIEKRQLPPENDKQAFRLAGGEVARIHSATV